MKLLDIYSRKKRDIASIEKSLERSIDVDLPTLRDASLLYLKAGGKRIRPVFVLLAGEFGHYDLERMKHIAVPLELIHMASLVHDDVIDDAETRRGKTTVRSKWDNRIAMYTGDYVYAKALTLVTELKNPVIHQIMSKAMIEMSIGEMEQIRLFFEHGQTLRDYLRRIKRKTALLIAVSCQLGAMTAEAPGDYAKRLFHFGYYVGMAFQIRDDILDLVGTEKQLGKPPGSDIKQGNITLPVLYALQEPQLRKPLLEELERIREADGQTDVSQFLKLIRESNGLEKADEIAENYIRKAIASIDPLPENQAKKDLVNIAHFIAKRSY